MKKKVN